MDHRDQVEAAAEDKTCPLALLPDDMLADVLGRLPPRGIAVSRCVCKAWLAVVDARPLLRADLLPLSLGGLFLNFDNLYLSEFFAPVSSPSISGKHNYLPDETTVSRSWGYLDDHCNGLVLIHDFDYNNGNEIGYVLNPATRWLAPLPPCPPPPIEIKDTFQFEYLAYDPAESPYYEVVSVTRSRILPRYSSSKNAVDPEIEEEYEWPPLVCILNVFSSRTGQWEQRSFTRESDSIGTVSGLRPDWPKGTRNAVYWRGALYVRCKTECVIRLSLLSAKYHMIKPPPGTEVNDYPHFYLGKSSKGVYCASIKGRCRVQVWNLDESGCRMEWILKHDNDLSKSSLKHSKLEYSRPCYGRKIQGPWALQDINYYHYNRNIDHNMEAPTEEKVECTLQASEDEVFTWSSDDECRHRYDDYMEILGFHPYKEIIFLRQSINRGLAYDLNSCKVEVLGSIYPAGQEELPYDLLLESSFLYTPCWMTQTGDDGE